ncbi:MAG: NADH:ubiquinone reductase (Na(+)-transporting) subunit D [Thermoguttaceae bacterium]
MSSTKQLKILTDPIITNNPIAIQMLGICSALAVTTSMNTTLTMCIAVTFVAVASNVGVSMIRNIIPGNIRMIVQMTIIASMVIVVDEFLKAYQPEISRKISVFVGLIITNCIIMGRTEAFAIKNKVWDSFLDGLGNGLGYSVVLFTIGAIREIVGFGTFFGYPVLKSVTQGGWYPGNGLMVLSPGAFFLIGFFIWGLKTWKPELIDKDE